MALPQFTFRDYGGGAIPSALAAPLTNTATSFTVANAASWQNIYGHALGAGNGGPFAGPFVVAVDYGTPNEEKILCSLVNLSTGVITVYTDGLGNTGRGYDGTTAVAHTVSGSSLSVPVWSAVEADEANRAVSETIGKITTLGDMLIGHDANEFDRLAIGANGYALTSNGTTASWNRLTSANLGSGAAAAGEVLASDGSGGVVWTAEPYGSDSGWINVLGGIGFTNGWGQFITTVSYRKIGNRVTLRGGIGDGTAATSAFTLPTGFCPAQDSRFACDNGATTSINSVTITAAGLVEPFTGGTGARAFLDGISFLTD